MISALIIFIIILAILIFAHELGHFIMAKKTGVRVEEFGFGFPPRLLSLKKGETTYSINLFPLGGFVKIYGEGGEGKDDKKSFASKSISQRALILAAGVLMNFVLAALLFGVGHKIGMPTIIEQPLAGGKIKNLMVQINVVAPGSPAQKTGLEIGDEFKTLKFGSQITQVEKAENVTSFIGQHKGQEIILTVQRGKKVLDLSIIPRENPPAGEGPIGIGLSDVAIVSYPWLSSFTKGIVDTVNLTILIVVTLAGIIYKLIAHIPISGEILTGPVGIYKITAQTAQMGFIYVLNLTALLSINLGIINILPIPALDGGRLLFLAIEKIKGSPVSRKLETAFHTIGFALLILLMLLVTYKDIMKLF